ncbi:MAG: chemotaxis protein CheD [Sulfitobacter sp.]
MSPTTRITITQGGFHISDDPSVVISTLLGSCISCCLWDPIARLGGMNHMLIAGPQNPTHPREDDVDEIKTLIDGIIRQGAAKNRLQAKVFGGAKMLESRSNIGEANANFTLDYLAREGINCVAQSLGGHVARHILFRPTIGAARQKLATEGAAPPSMVLDRWRSGFI